MSDMMREAVDEALAAVERSIETGPSWYQNETTWPYFETIDLEDEGIAETLHYTEVRRLLGLPRVGMQDQDEVL